MAIFDCPTLGLKRVQPRRIPRAEHPVSRRQFSNASLKVLYGLREAGYEAYMVGGAVRDVYAGIKPKDFDVATNAHPEDVRRIFRNARMIGRRFVIAHVRFGDEIIEVTTFRGAISDSHERDDGGRILSDNQYGTLETDAIRRDFTVNALYYDIADFTVVDFVNGVEDVENQIIRLIGDPELRYREDPVRMLRAIRIANKLQFTIEPKTAEPIYRLAGLLKEIPAARLFDEVIKILLCRDAISNFRSLRSFGLFAELFPQVEATLLRHSGMVGFIEQALLSTVERIEAGKTVTPAFLYAAILWPSVAERFINLVHSQGHAPHLALQQASDEIIAQACLRVMIPKRFSMPICEIWEMQPRFEQRKSMRAKRLLTHPRFRAAYDFLLLRAATGDANPELAEWWTAAQLAGAGVDTSIDADIDEPSDEQSTVAAKKRRRRRNRNRSSAPKP